MTQTSSMLMLKRSYQLVSGTGKDSNKCEVRDNARNDLVVFRGTYKQCVAHAKKIGVWYS